MCKYIIYHILSEEILFITVKTANRSMLSVKMVRELYYVPYIGILYGKKNEPYDI
jgi:hypothetical protein